MPTLYHSDPTTGEVYETIEANTPGEKEHLMSVQGGLWFETPRWHRNPKPHGFDPSNPYESPVVTPYVELPRLLYKRDGFVKDKDGKDTKEPHFKTLLVKDRDAKILALKGGYLLVPNPAQHEALAESDAECRVIAASKVPAGSTS